MKSASPTAPSPATAPQPQEPSARIVGTKRNPIHILTFHEPDESAQMRAIRLVLERD